MRNTPPKPPPDARPDEGLIEDLCVSLRDVAVHEWGLPDDPRARRHIAEAQSFAAELSRRGIDVGPRIERLSDECRWQMDALLRDCLAFPSVVPYVREPDGIRRALRCLRCRAREQADRNALFGLCPSCLAEGVAALRTMRDVPGFLLYRTVTAAARCEHAGDQTPVLFPLYWYDDAPDGRCERCLTDEQTRQQAAASAPGRS